MANWRKQPAIWRIGGGWLRRLTWRKYEHAHEPNYLVWLGKLGAHRMLIHHHEHPFIDHFHEADLPCDRDECKKFPPHRIHPQPGLARMP